MKKASLILFTTIAIPALALSQTTVNPTPAPAPPEEKPVPPVDPVPVPALRPVPVPDVPPIPVPAVRPDPIPVAPPVETVKPGEAAPAPLPTLDPRERGKGKGKGKGKGRLEKEDKNDPRNPTPTEPSLPLPVRERQPAPGAIPPVPGERMQRPAPRPAEGDNKTPPQATPLIPTPAPALDPDQRPGVPRTRPVPSPTMPAQPPGVPAPAVTTPPVRTVGPKDGERRVRPERPVTQKPPSEETAKVLEDQGKRDRKADAQQAEKIEDKDDAKRLLMTILGGAVEAVAGDRPTQPRPGERPDGRSRRGYRPPVEEVGRTQQDRERNVGIMVERFQGRAPQTAPPDRTSRDQRSFETSQTQRHIQFYEGNRRVVRYSSVQEIPPVIVASQRLNRVQVIPLSQSSYTARPDGSRDGQYYNEVPPSYTATDAYAVSYGVDPDSAISRDDILFRQGSTDFADAYSYDLVIDVAEALNAPELLNETFVIEGHASAEGDYGQNLLLSQERAERISRELVRHGVSPDRLMPVGYGETEAAYPANAADSERSLDRRVMVFRMR